MLKDTTTHKPLGYHYNKYVITINMTLDMSHTYEYGILHLFHTNMTPQIFKIPYRYVHVKYHVATILIRKEKQKIKYSKLHVHTTALLLRRIIF